jgi:hypothetical protein
MELIPSWEAANYAATQELHSNLWNPQVYYRVHKSPPLVLILSQMDLVHTIQSYFSKIHFILFTHLRVCLPNGLSFWISHKYPICITLRPHSCYRHNSAIAILHTLQFTVTHALGLSVFTSRILATDLSRFHSQFKSHTKSSLHSLTHFLTLFCSCQFRRSDSIQFLYFEAHISAGWSLETRLFISDYYSLLFKRHSLSLYYSTRTPRKTSSIGKDACLWLLCLALYVLLSRARVAWMCLPIRCLVMSILVTVLYFHGGFNVSCGSLSIRFPSKNFARTSNFHTRAVLGQSHSPSCSHGNNNWSKTHVMVLIIKLSSFFFLPLFFFSHPLSFAIHKIKYSGFHVRSEPNAFINERL